MADRGIIEDRFFVSAVAFTAATFRLLERHAGPLVDLLIRVWLAQTFFVSAIVKLADWNKALYLSANEYPVTWLDPVTAAYIGVSIEFLGALLLAFGLATRLAALAMLALVLVIHLNYLSLDLNLLQAALLAWFVVHGAGALSLDRMLSRGLADSALPLAAPVLSLLARFARRFTDLPTVVQGMGRRGNCCRRYRNRRVGRCTAMGANRVGPGFCFWTDRGACGSHCDRFWNAACCAGTDRRLGSIAYDWRR